jgi:predicted ATPase
VFVGRRHELELLDQWLDEAVAGHPRVVIVSRDVGVGNARLVRELQHRARTERDVEVCTGRCREHLDLPYLPFVSALLPRLVSLTRTDPRVGSLCVGDRSAPRPCPDAAASVVQCCPG